MTIFEDAREQIRLMHQAGRRPHTISFSNSGWDRVRAEHRSNDSALSMAAIGPRSYLGYPHRVDRNQVEPVLVLAREQVERKHA